MQIPAQTKPALLGVAVGAAAVALIGFSWGGWVTGSSAEALASERAQTAVVAALTPVCVDRFERSADAAVHLAALKKVKSWEQGSYVKDGGWANMVDDTGTATGLARACAEALTKTDG